jgi:hypothetical protein
MLSSRAAFMQDALPTGGAKPSFMGVAMHF